MPIIYTNFTKTHTFPLLFRFSIRPKCLKSSQCFNMDQNHCFSSGFLPKTSENNNGSRPKKTLPWIVQYNGGKNKGGERSVTRKTTSSSWEESANSYFMRNGLNSAIEDRESLIRTANDRKNGGKPDFSWDERAQTGKSSSYSWEDSENIDFVKSGGNPTIDSRERRTRTVDGRKNGKKDSFMKDQTCKTSSSWEDSENYNFSRNRENPKLENRESKIRTVGGRKNAKKGVFSWEEKAHTGKTRSSSWEDSENGYFSRNRENPTMGNKESWIRTVDGREKGKGRCSERDEEDKEEDFEAVNDPRWDSIKDKYRRMVDRENGSERPEVFRWNKQENWGRKTWKEATDSTVPKMVGEEVYGIGPVLAALTVGRREFYALYVQEGLDLSGNNRKKKDKKGVEKVLRIAERIGLSMKEASKHDLNMIVDNRPHQGLVLDASPLDMVRISELEPVSSEGKKCPLWVALDEVTDPQNLGAIVRSSYFFGAEGVVVCAKNSAPLSGVVSKASAGSLELIELRSCKNMMQFLASSIENGWRVLGGSVSSRALPLNEVVAGEPTILVLGSEGRGLRPLVERSCTQLVRIPGNLPASGFVDEIGDVEIDEMGHEEFQSFLAVESLNVSVAAGVLIYYLMGNSDPLLGHKKLDT